MSPTARRIDSCIRTGDLSARLGGDEFAVLLRDVDIETADRITERISDALSLPASISGITVDTQSSIGVAFATAGLADGTLLRDADSALYAAKAAGKGRWRRFREGMPAPTRQHLGVRDRLANAVAAHRLTLHYQPIVETVTGRAVGFEALLRIADSGPPMSAAEIIRAAETTGLVTDIGDWVLDQALRDRSRFSDRYVAVNVAARQLRMPDYADRVRAALARTATDPLRLVLEVTEADLVEEDDRAWRLLADLHDDGVRIAIDDYGTGYASLSYLRQRAIDIVKVDASFLADLTSERARSLVKAVTDLTAERRLEQIAEGVEDERARSLLVELGCPLAQGYLFSRPLPVDAAHAWLSNGGGSR